MQCLAVSTGNLRMSSEKLKAAAEVFLETYLAKFSEAPEKHYLTFYGNGETVEAFRGLTDARLRAHSAGGICYAILPDQRGARARYLGPTTDRLWCALICKKYKVS